MKILLLLLLFCTSCASIDRNHCEKLAYYKLKASDDPVDMRTFRRIGVVSDVYGIREVYAADSFLGEGYYTVGVGKSRFGECK